MTLSRLFGPCALGHGDLVRSRDAHGALILSCLRCHAPIAPVLAGGIEHAAPLPQHVAGQPTGRAQRVTKANLTPMTRRWK